MASQKTKFTVGLFLVVGISLIILVTIWLGMSHFFQEGQYYVTYFNESVQGLETDSIVKYRGVPIGRVESIDVAPDAKLIQVTLKIESGQELDKNIVAQLKLVGITGSIFVELDHKADGEPDQSPSLNFPSEYRIVASRPSEIKELLQGVDDLLRQLNSLDIGGISQKVQLSLDNINQRISEANIKRISDSLESSLVRIEEVLNDQRLDRFLTSMDEAGNSFNHVMAKMDRSLSQLETTLNGVQGVVTEEKDNLKRGIEDFRKAMEKASALFTDGSSLVRDTDESMTSLMEDLSSTVQNLERASENLNELIESLEEQPWQLLFSEPPLPRGGVNGEQ
ncbi:MAG: MCE family protein [Deltaproteobacteria bacterium]|nr:MCE family protein [Deltaproteobacteria bacterium]